MSFLCLYLQKSVLVKLKLLITYFFASDPIVSPFIDSLTVRADIRYYLL